MSCDDAYFQSLSSHYFYRRLQLAHYTWCRPMWIYYNLIDSLASSTCTREDHPKITWKFSDGQSSKMMIDLNGQREISLANWKLNNVHPMLGALFATHISFISKSLHCQCQDIWRVLPSWFTHPLVAMHDCRPTLWHIRSIATNELSLKIWSFRFLWHHIVVGKKKAYALYIYYITNHIPKFSSIFQENLIY